MKTTITLFTLALPLLGLAANTFKAPDPALARLDYKFMKMKHADADCRVKSMFPDVNKDAPAGTRVEYQRSSEGWMPYYGMIYPCSDTGCAVSVVTADDGKTVYMNYPVSHIEANYWIKGEIVDNTMVFELPQPIYASPKYDDNYQPIDEIDYTLYAAMMDRVQVEVGEDGEPIYSYVQSEDQKLIYDLDGDVITSRINGSEHMMGVMNDQEEWIGYSDGFLKLTKVDTELLKPQGEGEEWSFIYEGELGHFTKVAIEGDDIYIQGVFKDLPESWVKGTVRNGELYFDSGQYMGLSWSFQWEPPHHAVFYGVEYDKVEDPDWGTSYYPAIRETVKIKWNFENKWVQAEELGGFALNSGFADDMEKDQYLLFGYRFPTFIYQEASNSAQTPMPPYILRCDPYDEMFGSGLFGFDFAPFSVDGVLLHPEHLFYNIYVNGELLTLTPEDYPCLTEPTTDVPFTLNDTVNYKIMTGTLTNLRLMEYYNPEAKTLGVRFGHRVGGETKYTDIITADVTGVAAPVADDTEAEYYNLNGVRVNGNNLANGIYIKKQGNKTTKFVVR